MGMKKFTNYGIILIVTFSALAHAGSHFESQLKNAKEGDALAQYEVYLSYSQGSFVNQDDKEALRWLKAAVQNDQSEAQVALGRHYLKGSLGLEKNDRLARKWITLAAEQSGFFPETTVGHPYAQYLLGKMYLEGSSGVLKYPEEAAKWLKKSAFQGFWLSQFELGEMYYSGTGVKQNYSLSAMWFEAAVYTSGGREAKVKLAYMYYKGLGVEKDGVASAKLYREAALDGSYTS
jgi:TPR repeat protein